MFIFVLWEIMFFVEEVFSVAVDFDWDFKGDFILFDIVFWDSFLFVVG